MNVYMALGAVVLLLGLMYLHENSVVVLSLGWMEGERAREIGDEGENRGEGRRKRQGDAEGGARKMIEVGSTIARTFISMRILLLGSVRGTLEARWTTGQQLET